MVEKKENSRRNFIKKAAYIAPTVIALGSITNPSSARAGASQTSVREENNAVDTRDTGTNTSGQNAWNSELNK